MKAFHPRLPLSPMILGMTLAAVAQAYTGVAFEESFDNLQWPDCRGRGYPQGLALA